jgi:nucleotide-binding universal stress UspA family protein
MMCLLHQIKGMSKRILVPVDGSDHSWKAFDYALEEHREDELTILHVIDPMQGDYEPDESNARAVKRSDTIRADVETRLEETGDGGPEVDVVTREGKPADEIIDHANTDEIDQVVMGSRGLSGVKRLLLGSVAETVVRRAEVPVNIVR